ncbi:MAG: DUF2029 domain-containing protein [Planctomycetes bacterium]|nr:DUF2029 domain-containing protein [Planctomycetota bacterium]
MATRRRAARFVWPLVWVALGIVLVARATGRPSSRGVILDHLEFGRRLLAGEDVHGPWKSDPDAPVRPLHAPYPPSFGLMTAPFAVIDAVLGPRAARAGWALLQVLALAAMAWQLRRLTAGRAPPGMESTWHWLWFGTFLLGARFILRDAHGGGGNLINVAMCLLAFGSAERGRPVTAGLLLGFSLLTKPTQLWLLPVFWLLGHRRAAASTVLAGVAGVVLTLALQRFDLAPWLRWFEGSFALALQSDPWAVPALEFPPFEWMNQSLRCAVARWCGTVPDEFAARVALGVPAGLGLSATTVALLARALNLALIAGLLLSAWRARPRAAARLWLFAAALVASVLLSPLSWKAHHTALLPILFLLLQEARWRRSRRAAAAMLLGGWALCCAVPGRDLVGDDLDEWLNSVYVVTFWDLVLLGVALALAHRVSVRSATACEHDDAAFPAP